MLNEFHIINQYFSPHLKDHPEIIQGIGDDAAIWRCDHATMVTSVDTMLEGRHFFPDCNPADLAYKALAVNLSDFAAMGATPRWFTLALTLPKADAAWLRSFSQSLLDFARANHVALIGGDTTKGPLSVTIQVIGTIDPNKMLLRSGAKVGDDIYVSGTIGDAGLALEYLQKKRDLAQSIAPAILQKFNRPEPQLRLGQLLAGHAHAAIDISDGLAQDLQHILTASHVGAEIFVEKFPLSSELKKSINAEEAYHLALTAGDDYQLCFTLNESQKHLIENVFEEFKLTQIGKIVAKSGLRIYQQGEPYTREASGFTHF